ncbi:hypothetical protein WJX73_000566 [Symbiochloris irregularis]|uniref:Uncharacterized protein n=1 Tax=Symbiochloris irregularis TaxID=706552 RepID=A0AAW1P151_9CHLO
MQPASDSDLVDDVEWAALHNQAYNSVKGADVVKQQRAQTNMTGLSSTMHQNTDGWRHAWDNFWGLLSYRYFLWRKDTSSDLLLFAGFNVGLLLTGSIIKHVLVDKLDNTLVGMTIHDFWLDIWSVLVVVLGQELPDKAEPVIDQAFALLIAATGLAAFALVLALVEQVVLEVLQRRVSIGSPVYERGHVVILGWLENQRDEEVLWKLLTQLCQAYRNDGGKVIVILTRVPKLTIESTFRRTIPEDLRFGTTFVFRQGSVLVPGDLRSVAAAAASSIVIISDRSRPPEEADAQAVRAAVLLDELDFPGFEVPDTRTAPILVEVKTANAVRLLSYACSPRVQPLPTAQANARRICRMVRSPVVGSVSSELFSFNSRSQAFLENCPQLAGNTVEDLPFFFPDGIVFGLVNHSIGRVKMNPPPTDVMEPGDEILVIRPTTFKTGSYRPAAHKKIVDEGDWSPVDYSRASIEEGPSSADLGSFRAANSGHPFMQNEKFKKGSRRASQPVALFSLPLEAGFRATDPQRVLICGWLEGMRMSLLLQELDHGTAALPKASEVVLFNQHDPAEVMDRVVKLSTSHNVTFSHIQGNPLDQRDLKTHLDLTAFSTAILLCDHMWLDPDLKGGNGVEMGEENDMLRLDSMMLVVQLNLRQLMEEAGFPNLNLISEKISFEGVTRFEDKYRLPMGISVNQSGFSATLMAQAIFNTKILLPYQYLGKDHEMTIQDVSSFAAPGEVLSFWQLQKRVGSVGQVLYGFFRIPQTVAEPIDIVINPCGDAVRSLKRIWNCGDHRRKIITMAPRDEEPIRTLPPFVSQDIPADQPTTTALENALMRQLRGLPSVSSEYT